MLAFDLLAAKPAVERIVVVGCHADDIEIGCGGTLLALTRARPELQVTWVVLAAHGRRAEEARVSAGRFLAGVESPEIRVLQHRESFLPHEASAVKESFEELKSAAPDLVFTHTRSDLHQDHRLACELTWNTFRDHLILEYEIPKYDGDLGAPNVFFPLERDLVDEKLTLLRELFPSQATRHWFDDELFRGLMRLRGMECASVYAEAFTCRKLRLGRGG